MIKAREKLPKQKTKQKQKTHRRYFEEIPSLIECFELDRLVVAHIDMHRSIIYSTIMVILP